MNSPKPPYRRQASPSRAVPRMEGGVAPAPGHTGCQEGVLDETCNTEDTCRTTSSLTPCAHALVPDVPQAAASPT